MNFFNEEVLVTLLELQGQELIRLQHDLKIKEESELPQIKDMIKKCENYWKMLHSQLIKKIGLRQESRGTSANNANKTPEENTRLFTLIRFQIQVLYSPLQLIRELSEEGEEKSKRFSEALCKGLATNMINYFRLISDRSMLVEAVDSSSKFTIRDIDPAALTEFRDQNLDLYWLEMISLNLDQVLRNKSKKQAPSSRALNIKLMMSMNNLKKSFKEYSEFAVSFGAYYERYFLENEVQDSDVELIRNFGRLVYLFTKGFSVPGRQKLEDVRAIFLTLLKAFRIPQIVPKILLILKENFSKASLLLGNAFGLREEMTVLIYNIYKMLSFSMLSLDIDQIFFKSLFKIWVFLCSQIYDSLGFLRMNRLLHLLTHKPSVNETANQYWAHAVYFDYEVKIMLCANALNLIKTAKSPTDLSVKMAEKELLQLYRCLYCNFL